MKTIKLDHGIASLRELYKLRAVQLNELRGTQKEISETELQLLLGNYTIPSSESDDKKDAPS